MNGAWIVVMALLLVGQVSAAQVIGLNSIDYLEGQTIEIGTKVVDDAAQSITDASCQSYVTKDVDNSIALSMVNLTYDATEETYKYLWVPELTWWEEIEQIWNPAVGNYRAYIVCEGGSLANMLVDSVEIRVVNE